MIPQSNQEGTRRLKSRKIALGVVSLVIGFVMAISVDSGFTQDWPSSARSLWAFALIALMMGGVALIIYGFGFTTSEELAQRVPNEDPKSSPPPTTAIFFGTYFGLLVVAVAISLAMENAYGVSDDVSIPILGGLVFLVASTKHPWWLYSTIRRLSWFSLIESEHRMRLLLGVLGFCLVFYGILKVVPPDWLMP